MHAKPDPHAADSACDALWLLAASAGGCVISGGGCFVWLHPVLLLTGWCLCTTDASTDLEAEDGFLCGYCAPEQQQKVFGCCSTLLKRAAATHTMQRQTGQCALIMPDTKRSMLAPIQVQNSIVEPSSAASFLAIHALPGLLTPLTSFSNLQPTQPAPRLPESAKNGSALTTPSDLNNVSIHSPYHGLLIEPEGTPGGHGASAHHPGPSRGIQHTANLLLSWT